MDDNNFKLIDGNYEQLVQKLNDLHQLEIEKASREARSEHERHSTSAPASFARVQGTSESERQKAYESARALDKQTFGAAATAAWPTSASQAKPQARNAASAPSLDVPPPPGSARPFKSLVILWLARLVALLILAGSALHLYHYPEDFAEGEFSVFVLFLGILLTFLSFNETRLRKSREDKKKP